MGRHEWYSGERRWRVAALLGVTAAAPALVVAMLGTLPNSSSGAEGTSRDGDKAHGTPAAPPAEPKPDVGWGFTR